MKKEAKTGYMEEDGTIGTIRQTIQGVEQIGYPDPYEKINACTFSHQAGLTPVPSDMLSKSYGAGDMALGGIDSGDHLKLSDVDFSHKSANQIHFTVAKTDEVDENCVIQLRLDSLKGDILANVPIGELLNESGAQAEEFTTITFPFKQEVNGVHNLYMIFLMFIQNNVGNSECSYFSFFNQKPFNYYFAIII